MSASHTTQTTTAKFAQLWDLEFQTRTNHALAAMGSDLNTRERGRVNYLRTHSALLTALDALTMDEARAYGEYRKAQR